MIKRITSSKGIVTAVWVLGLVVIWEICAFIVGATQRTPRKRSSASVPDNRLVL